MSVPHVNNSTLPSWMLAERTRIVTSKNPRNLENENGNCIFYWMQRDVRTVDNWALLYGTHLAQKANVPLRVVYCLPPPPTSYQNDRLAPKMLLEAPMTERYGTFLLGGVEQVHEQLKSADVPFHVVKPSSHDDVGETLMACLDEWQPRAVVCDTSPLKPYRKWMEEQLAPLLETQGVPLIQVDAHNVVPVWHASPKREIGARTLRSKLSKLMPEFLTEYPDIRVGNSHLTDSAKPKTFPGFSKQDYIKFLGWDDSVPPVDWCQPGTENAEHQIEDFLKNGLSKFDQLRNNPNYGREICSNLSPWINHGHISFQTIAKKVKSLNKYANGTASFLEEGIVRRELSDNYVYYTPDNYDELEAALGWAQETLATHASDKREWLFSRDELEEGHSHDDLWNAAQLQLVSEGKLHGFLRMYWAKKILEWTDSPLTALRTAQYFNDKFALDGCDPNGFVGVGWSIMGIHDQGWKEREIFGKIRYMNYAGCKRKFDVANFVAKYPSALENAIAAAKALGKERETGAGKPKKTDSNKKKKTAAGTKRKR
mmetsp:Transcript_14067/g.20788  ORF Transcript_14067/g.20788 Transcript_14067/m.20788 type:complete len:541 (-) Transcript_14067:3399-5021(-)